MSREYPDWLDPRKAAEGKRTFAGSMPLKRMPRLAPLLAGSEGEARFSATFGFDRQQRVTIDIAVEADLPLVCQTSLDTYNEPIRRQSLLGVMEDLAEEAMMPENYEPVLAVNGRLALQDLVEDELLLGMPQVPRKPQAGAEMQTAEAQEARQPFAGLADQLKKFAAEKERGR